MGYNLYITRGRYFGDDRPGSLIPIEEWQSYVNSDRELRMDDTLGEYTAVWSGPSKLDTPWLQWYGGSIETKYPDEALIAKMAEIASALGAIVQGDDGETYDRSGRIVPTTADINERPPPGFFDGLKSLFLGWVAWATRPEVTVDVPFKVGDRVRDIFGDKNTATITKIDLKSYDGMGRITVRYDDGRVGEWMAIAPGFEPVPTEEDPGGP